MIVNGNEVVGGIKYNFKILSLKFQKYCKYMNRNDESQFGKVIVLV